MEQQKTRRNGKQGAKRIFWVRFSHSCLKEGVDERRHGASSSDDDQDTEEQ